MSLEKKHENIYVQKCKYDYSYLSTEVPNAILYYTQF